MFWSDVLDWEHYIKLMVGLLILVDPVGTAPVFLNLVEARTRSEKTRIAVVGTLVMAVTLIVFAFFGEQVLGLFGISISAFQIAGGLFLLITAFEMILARPLTTQGEEGAPTPGHAVGIVPLGIPLLAGPAAISMIILHVQMLPSLSHKLVLTATIVSIAAITLCTLVLAHRFSMLESRFGKTGMVVFTRLMGLIVLAIAVEFIIDGLGIHFPGLL